MGTSRLTNFIRSLLKILLFFSLLIFLSCNRRIDMEPAPEAVKGYLDLSGVNLTNREVVNLDGEWEFYWKKLIRSEPESINPSNEMIYTSVPGSWNGMIVGGEKLSGYGYASYRLKLSLAREEEYLAIKVLDMATSFNLWVNGVIVFQNGKVGKTAESTIPQYRPDIIFLKNMLPENEIVVEVANFSHSKGGFWESMRLGSMDGIHDMRERILGFDLFLVGSLLIMGIYHFGLFSLRRKDKSSFLLGLFCFIIVVRLLTTGERLFHNTFPNLNWEVSLKIEYLTFFAATPVFAHFLHSLYKEEFKQVHARFILFSSLFFIFLLVFPGYLLTRTAIPFQVITLYSMSYGVLALIRAIRKNKEGSLVALIGFIILFIAIFNDILYANLVINTTTLTPFGLFAFIFSQAFLLSVRFSKAFFNVEVLSQSLIHTNKAYSRFVPIEFLSYLEKENIMDVSLGDQVQRKMTILFSDIRSFTSISENMSPEENFNFINSYLSAMNPSIRDNNGFIDKYIGDAIMALFPTPDDAVRASLSMLKKLDEFNESQSILEEPLRIGIGIHTGNLMLGTVGDTERMEGTVISDAVNLASRLEGLTKNYGANIIVSEQTMLFLEESDGFGFRFLGKVEVKGKREPASVFEIFEADPTDLKDKKYKSKVMFEMAINAFFSGEVDRASIMFQNIYRENNGDRAAKYYLEKCNFTKNYHSEITDVKI